MSHSYEINKPLKRDGQKYIEMYFKLQNIAAKMYQNKILYFLFRKYYKILLQGSITFLHKPSINRLIESIPLPLN